MVDTTTITGMKRITDGREDYANIAGMKQHDDYYTVGEDADGSDASILRSLKSWLRNKRARIASGETGVSIIIMITFGFTACTAVIAFFIVMSYPIRH